MAGLGGFSGRESTVSAAWLAMEVRDGRLRWVIASSSGQGFGGIGGDSRKGSESAFATVAKACVEGDRSGQRDLDRRLGGSTGATSSTATTMYDCRGRSAAILAAAQ